VEAGKQQGGLIGHGDCVTTVAVSPDDKQIALSSRDMTVRIWDVETGNHVDERIVRHAGSIQCVGYRIAYSSNDTTARIWDLYTGEWVNHSKGTKIW